MLGKEPGRKPSSGACIAVLAVVCWLDVGTPARAEDLWDTVLRKMDIKAAPAAPGPDFIERTRPDPGDLGYLPTAVPHKVSPRPVKTAAEIQAQKDALDAARQHQLNPDTPKPLGPVKGHKVAKPKPADATD